MINVLVDVEFFVGIERRVAFLLYRYLLAHIVTYEVSTTNDTMKTDDGQQRGSRLSTLP